MALRYSQAGALTTVEPASGPARGPPGQRRAGTGQLAWLTDDMLNPSTRTGGMDTRLK